MSKAGVINIGKTTKVRRYSTKHDEEFRVSYFTHWPTRTQGAAHRSKYFASYDTARAWYMEKCLEQHLEVRRLDKVVFERKGSNGEYVSLFESYVFHTDENEG